MTPWGFLSWITRTFFRVGHAGASMAIPGGCFTLAILSPVFVIVGFFASFFHLGRSTFHVIAYDSPAAKLAVFTPAALGIVMLAVDGLTFVVLVFASAFVALLRDLFVRYRTEAAR